MVGGQDKLAAQTPVTEALAAGPVVSPTRLVLEGRDRSGSFLVANTSTVPITYRVEFTNQRMLEDGSFEPFNLPRADELVLVNEATRSRLVLFSPRQFTLQPNQVQVVRLQLRKPADLASGEYRSHLVFSAIPPADTGRGLSGSDSPQGIAIQLIPIKGVSVPIIMRHGDISGSVSLSEVSVAPGADGTSGIVNMRMNRSGDASVYGDLSVAYVDGAGQDVQVGLIKGIAVYTPNATRTVSIPFQIPEGAAAPTGPLQIRFNERADAGGAEIASTSVPFR
jgi:hypothetical protein